MNTDKDVLSYGRYLKAMRLEKGISLEEISQETRIGKDILLRIEREDGEALPAEVFVKGFLRAYAKVIGIDGEEAVQKYLAQLESAKETIVPQKLYVKPRRRFWPLLLTVLVMLAGLILLSIYLTGDPRLPQVIETDRNSSAEDTGARTQIPAAVTKEATQPAVAGQPAAATDDQSAPEIEAAMEETAKPMVADAVGEAAVKEIVKPPIADPEKLTLTVVAKEETWMKVIIDSGKPREYTLNVGDRLDLAGKANFNLLIGNAGGVDLSLNGTPVEVPGRSGQVLTLQLP